MPLTVNIRSLSKQLVNFEISCEKVLSNRIEIAKQHSGIFTWLDETSLLSSAVAIDNKRKSSKLAPLSGVPVSLKDLYDVQGQKTIAAAKVLTSRAHVAKEDAAVIKPLREAGILFFGRTNMSEFAFSGMGLNPHFPALYSVWDEPNKRLPGGSSSGSAVSVAKGIVPATLGSDTTGSCRIPAAFNGIVGMKPSHGHLPLKGIYPLSHSCDTPGPLAVDVDSCFLLYELMKGKQFNQLPLLRKTKAESLHFLIPEGIVMQDLAPEVSNAFEVSVAHLKSAGVTISRQPVEAIERGVDMFFNRNTVIFEAWQLHEALMESHGDEYDPYVYQRVLSGKNISQAEQALRYAEKAEIVAKFQLTMQKLQVDALLFPTVACIPPKTVETENSDEIGQVNLRCLRNTSAINYVDGCAISLPCHEEGEAPVGLMLSSVNGDDDRLLSMAATVETILKVV